MEKFPFETKVRLRTTKSRQSTKKRSNSKSHKNQTQRREILLSNSLTKIDNLIYPLFNIEGIGRTHIKIEPIRK